MDLQQHLDAILSSLGAMPTRALLASAATVGVVSSLGCPMTPSCPPIETTEAMRPVDAANGMHDQVIETELAERKMERPDTAEIVFLAEVYGVMAEPGKNSADAALVPPTYMNARVRDALLAETTDYTARARLCAAICGATPEIASWLEKRNISAETPSLNVNCNAVDGALQCAAQDGYECIGGRRPPGLTSSGDLATPGAIDPIGAWWASLCHLEEAAVHAFAHLAMELRALGAPDALVARALDAMRDEIVHVQLTREMALRHGVTPARAICTPTPTRTLEALALDNAAEGCAREAFAALETGWQAAHTIDPHARLVLAQISADETRHGQLSWDIHAWAMTLLDAETAARVTCAHHDALAALRASTCPTTSPDALGLPDTAQRAALLDAFASATHDALAA